MEVCFWCFAQTEKEFTGSVVSVVDVCLHAMVRGTLPVITKQMGYLFLWELFILTTDQWARTCALLQRHRLPPSLLWTLKTRVECTWRSISKETCMISEVPVAVTALSRIEFLWQDLDAVDAWLCSIFMRLGYCDVEWVAAEVARRRQWFAGLCRTWLLAVVG